MPPPDVSTDRREEALRTTADRPERLTRSERLRSVFRAERPRLLPEILLLVVVYGMYSLIRNFAPDQVEKAQHNARVILDAERLIGLDVEKGINLAGASLPWLIVPANYYYATLHFIVTGAVLVWLYRCHPTHYAPARGILLAMTLLALLGYWFYPLAPPRLMTGGGYIDTVREYTIWGVEPSDDLPSVSNQYAAMPSMHFGWALWAGVALAWLAHRRWMKVLGILYPIVTLYVVVVTANHFVLDAVAGAVLFVVAPLFAHAWATATARAPCRRPVDAIEAEPA